MKAKDKSRFLSLLFIIFFTFHIIGIFIVLPPKVLISSNPIFTDDYPFHYYHYLIFEHAFLHDGQFWVYNPNFAAGIAEPLASDFDNRFCEVFTLAFSFLSPIYAFKIFVFIAFIFSPLLLYFAGKNLEMSSGGALLCFIILWGMFSYLLGLFLSIYLISLLYNWLKHPNIKEYIILLLLSIILFWIHALCPIFVIIPAFIFWFMKRTKVPIIASIFLFIIPFVVFISAFVWIYPSFNQGYYSFLKGGSLINDFNILQIIPHFLLLGSFKNNYYLPILILGIIGLYYWRKNEEKEKYISFALNYIFIFFLYYFFYFKKIYANDLPQRFIFAMNLFFIIPASVGIKYIFLAIRPYLKQREVRLTITVLLILLIPTFISPYLKSIGFLPQAKSYLHRAEISDKTEKRIFRISSTISPDYKKLISWIKQNTTLEARILLEDSGRVTHHKHDGGHMLGLLSFYTNREYIGGPYPYSKAFTDFYEGRLFNRPIERFSFHQLIEYMELYNIKWIISFYTSAVKCFNSYPEYFIFKEKIGDFSIYEVNREPNYFIKGEGKIKAELNKIELSEIKGREIVIKYHWISTLKTKPELHIEAFKMLEDPNGFIKVINPSAQLLIYNAY
jgi:hypothetical protein